MDVYGHLADTFLGTYDDVRGRVRAELVARQLDESLPPGRLEIVDVGGGGGPQCVRLAQLGHRVTVVDPSATMLGRTRETLRREGTRVRSRVRLVEEFGEYAPTLLGRESFDAVLCHGVLMYLAEPAEMLQALAALVRPSGLVSILFKNRDALAARSALEGRWRDAQAAFDGEYEVGGVGVPTRADRLADVSGALRALGVERLAWYGVRVFTDHLGKRKPDADWGDLIEVEDRAAQTDPYRRLGRLIHLLGRAAPR